MPLGEEPTDFAQVIVPFGRPAATRGIPGQLREVNGRPLQPPRCAARRKVLMRAVYGPVAGLGLGWDSVGTLAVASLFSLLPEYRIVGCAIDLRRGAPVKWLRKQKRRRCGPQGGWKPFPAGFGRAQPQGRGTVPTAAARLMPPMAVW